MSWPVRAFLGIFGLWVLVGLGNGLVTDKPAGAVAGMPGDPGPRYAPATGKAIPDDVREATFRFGPEVAVQDRQVVEAAVAGARPEARAIIAMVDGMTSVAVGATPAGSAGVTIPLPDGYQLMLDLGTVSRQLGPRGVSRLVLHELGHVIDFAVLPDDVRAQLDAGVPAGWGCDQGHSGACAEREERFAESFAKWAMNDIGVDLFIGYKIPPPPSLDAWGEPLARLAITG